MDRIKTWGDALRLQKSFVGFMAGKGGAVPYGPSVCEVWGAQDWGPLQAAGQGSYLEVLEWEAPGKSSGHAGQGGILA